MRADVDKRELAMLRGVNTSQISAVTWVLTMMLAGLGGCLLGPLYGMSDITYTLVVLGALAAIVFAGLRSLPLAFIGGLLLGVVQNMVAGYGNSFIPGFLLNLSGFRTAIPFILTFIGLIVLASRRQTHVRHRGAGDAHTGSAAGPAAVAAGAPLDDRHRRRGHLHGAVLRNLLVEPDRPRPRARDRVPVVRGRHGHRRDGEPGAGELRDHGRIRDRLRARSTTTDRTSRSSSPTGT